MNSTNMTKHCRDKSSVLYENRYCNQDEFDIVICGGENYQTYKPTNEVTKLLGPDFNTSVQLTPMQTDRTSSKIAVVGF